MAMSEIGSILGVAVKSPGVSARLRRAWWVSGTFANTGGAFPTARGRLEEHRGVSLIVVAHGADQRRQIERQARPGRPAEERQRRDEAILGGRRGSFEDGPPGGC